MAKIKMALARPPHEGRRFANTAISIEQALPASRVSLRAGSNELAELTKPLGFKLPTRPGTSKIKSSLSALWLGPDEWLLINSNPKTVSALMEKLDTIKCSNVDISHRNTAIIISGKAVEDVLNAGCPRDLSLDAFPPGSCSRTLFGKIEIILWRLTDDRFHIEVWRSYSEYLWAYLLDAAKDTG